MKTKLAAALSCLLPQSERDELRREKVAVDVVLRRFDWDHVVLHAHAGSDAWHNLTPMLRADHREKSRRDTAIVAKVKRLLRGTDAWVAAQITVPVKIVRPKRKIAQRRNPWPPKGSRPFRTQAGRNI